jgi:hypothetical protein
MDLLETTLQTYSLESISKPKRLPIMENNIDFPALKNCQIYIMEVIVKYPVMSEQVRSLISERLSIPASQIFVTPSSHPEELWRNNEGELREYVKGEAVLDKPYEDNPEGKKAGEAYANKETILKELNKPVKFDIAGSENADNKTLNDIPAGDKSPVGSTQNKLPVAKK